MATPGVIVDGELRTTRLSDVNLGIEEFVDHSYYQRWEGHRFQRDRWAPLCPRSSLDSRPFPSRLGGIGGRVHVGHSAALGPRSDGVGATGPAVDYRHGRQVGKRVHSRRPGGLLIDLLKERPRPLHSTADPRPGERPGAQPRSSLPRGLRGMVAYTFLLKALNICDWAAPPWPCRT